jgi:hypothetical protein
MNHDGRSLERPLARRRAGRDACVLLAPCSWGGLAGREKGVGLTFGSASPAGPRIYTRMRTPSIWRRGTARALLYRQRSAGPISAMGCDAVRGQPAAKWWARRQGLKKRREIAHGFASPRRGNSWDGMLLLLQCRQVHLSRGSGAGARGPRLSTSSSSSCLGLAFFVLFALTLLQMSKGRGERDVLEDSSPLSPVS